VTTVIVIHDGVESTLEGKAGDSLMQTIRNGGIPDLLALCGGCLSCATCHVYVDPAFADRVPPMSRDENDLLEGADDRRATSRLSCQITLVDELDGLRVTLPTK
jgi:2Fe-2S ferredoxin